VLGLRERRDARVDGARDEFLPLGGNFASCRRHAGSVTTIASQRTL